MFSEAEKADPTCCFPNRLEAVLALETAMEKRHSDARAPYYLGNLYYDKRQYELALILWEDSARLDPSFPTVWRNLALVWFNKMGNHETALECMEKAFSLDPTDSRVLMELDQLYKRLKKPNPERLAFLEGHPDLVEERDDLVLEHITLLNDTGQYSRAKELLDRHTFHPWEGGEGKAPAQYQFARTEMAKVMIAEGRFEEARILLEECLEYPHNLGEGKLIGAQENDFFYFLGCVHDGLGNIPKARECWEKAALGSQEPAPAMYYNDSKPEKILNILKSRRSWASSMALSMAWVAFPKSSSS